MNRKEKKRVKSHKQQNKQKANEQKQTEEQKQENDLLDQSKDSSVSQSSVTQTQSIVDSTQSKQLQEFDQKQQEDIAQLPDNKQQAADDLLNKMSIEIVDNQMDQNNKQFDFYHSSFEKIQKEDVNKSTDKQSFEIISTISPNKQNNNSAEIQQNQQHSNRSLEDQFEAKIGKTDDSKNIIEVQVQNNKQGDELNNQKEENQRNESEVVDQSKQSQNQQINEKEIIIEENKQEENQELNQQQQQKEEEVVVEIENFDLNVQQTQQEVSQQINEVQGKQPQDEEENQPIQPQEQKVEETKIQIDQSTIQNPSLSNEEKPMLSPTNKEEPSPQINGEASKINKEESGQINNDEFSPNKKDELNKDQNLVHQSLGSINQEQSPINQNDCHFNQSQSTSNKEMSSQNINNTEEKMIFEQSRNTSILYNHAMDEIKQNSSDHPLEEGEEEEKKQNASADQNSNSRQNSETPRKPILQEFRSPQFQPAVEIQSNPEISLQKTQSLELTKTISSQSQSLAMRRQITQYVVQKQRIKGQSSSDEDDDNAQNENSGSGEINDPLEWLRSPDNPHNRNNKHHSGGGGCGVELFKVKHIGKNEIPQIKITQQHQIVNLNSKNKGKMSNELKKSEQKQYSDNDERIEEFTNLYKVAEQLYKQGKYNDSIQHMAVATNIIHPNHFKKDISSFSDCVENLNKGFLLLAKAHFQIKDYYNCLGFLENILHNDKNYEAMKLKLCCYERLNYKKEVDQMVEEIYKFSEESGFCDMAMKDKFKELQLRRNDLENQTGYVPKKVTATDNISNSSESSLDNINIFTKHQSQGNQGDDFSQNVYMLKQFKKIVSQRSKIAILFNIISSSFVTLLGIFAFKKYLLKSMRGSVFWGAVIGLIFFIISHKFISTQKKMDSKRNSMEEKTKIQAIQQ